MITARQIAREWLWLCGCVAVTLTLYVLFILVAAPEYRTAPYRLVTDALYDQDHLGLPDLWLPIAGGVYGLVTITRLTVWAVRTLRTGATQD